MAPAEPAPDGSQAAIQVEVVFSPAARCMQRLTLSLPAAATVNDALLASQLVDPAQAGLSVGIWGRRASLGTRLRQDDRVEVYRGLTVDPKEARRVRQRAHADSLPKGRYRPKGRAQPPRA